MKTAQKAANKWDSNRPTFNPYNAGEEMRGAYIAGFEHRQPEIDKLREALQDCAEVLNLLASRAGIQTEDAALKSDAEDYGALAALRAAREILNNQNKTA